MIAKFGQCKSFVILCIAIPGIDFKEHLKCMDRFVGSVHLLQCKSFVVECFNTSLIQANCIVKGVYRILVSPQIIERLPVFNPSVNLIRVYF